MRMMRNFVFLLSALIVTTPAFGDDAAFVSGDFAGAEAGYAATLAQNKSDADAMAGLARIRLYQDRIADARSLAQQALSTSPENALAKKVIANCDMRDMAFAPDIYRIALPAKGAKIRFVATDPLPVVQVTVAGHVVNFLIDTGAPDLVQDKDFAAELKLPVAGGGEGTFAGGQKAAIARSELPELAMGSVVVKNVPVALMPTRGFMVKPGTRIDGIVGTGFLRHFLATIDYVKGELSLMPRSGSAAFEAAAAKNGATVVPMWLVGDHFLFARARLNNAPEAQFSIDTGLAGGGVQATKETLDAAHITPDEAHAHMGMGGGGMVKVVPFRADATLGNLTVRNVEGAYTPDGDQFGLFAFKIGGTLSHGFFRQHAVTFDFVAMRLVVS